MRLIGKIARGIGWTLLVGVVLLFLAVGTVAVWAKTQGKSIAVYDAPPG